MTNLKEQIRKQALTQRDALSSELRVQGSTTISQYASSLNISGGDIVGGYWPINSEIDPQALLTALEQVGAVLALPAVLSKTEIEFRAYANNDELVDAGFGTKAPNTDAQILNPDVLLMPLSAVDLQGNRCGYGAGYYDRYIASLKQLGFTPKLIGLAFDEQIFEDIPNEEHDEPLDGLITPTKCIWFD